MSVNGIATQGASDSRDWVMTYALGYSDDGLKWTPHFLTGRSPEVGQGLLNDFLLQAKTIESKHTCNISRQFISRNT